MTLPFNLIVICTFVTLASSEGFEKVKNLAQDIPEEQPRSIGNITFEQHGFFTNFTYLQEGASPMEISTVEPDVFNEENIISISWASILKGCLLGMGQVYAVESILSSILIYIAVLLYSPSLFFTSVMGSIVGKLH